MKIKKLGVHKCKSSNSHFGFDRNRRMLLKSRCSQSEVMVTILLILIGIAAVVVVSTFVINMVKNNLKDTGCLDATGQLSIDKEHSYTLTDSVDDWLYLSVERASKVFNMTGINVVYGNEFATAPRLKIVGNLPGRVYMVDLSGDIDDGKPIIFPQAGERYTYAINISSFGGVDKVDTVNIAPIIAPSTDCEISDEYSKLGPKS